MKNGARVKRACINERKKNSEPCGIGPCDLWILTFLYTKIKIVICTEAVIWTSWKKGRRSDIKKVPNPFCLPVKILQTSQFKEKLSIWENFAFVVTTYDVCSIGVLDDKSSSELHYHANVVFVIFYFPCYSCWFKR